MNFVFVTNFSHAVSLRRTRPFCNACRTFIWALRRHFVPFNERLLDDMKTLYVMTVVKGKEEIFDSFDHFLQLPLEVFGNRGVQFPITPSRFSKKHFFSIRILTFATLKSETKNSDQESCTGSPIGIFISDFGQNECHCNRSF